jgi:predicted ATP-grasp superfamily ATP-dependent carboligase
MNSPLTILIYEYITGGGLSGREIPRSLAREGGAMLVALAADFAASEARRVVVSVDERFERDIKHELNHMLASDYVETIRIGPGEERDRIVDAARSADYTLVIAPESDGLLAERADWIPVGRSLGSTRSAIELAGNKFALAGRWIGLGLPHPETIALAANREIPADFPFPAVLKPIDGAGGLNTRIVDRRDDLAIDEIHSGTYIIQKFITGKSMSAQFLIDRSGDPRLLAVGEQSIAWPGGLCRYGGGRSPVAVSREIQEILYAAARSVRGLHGWIGIDFIRQEKTDSIALIELNPRPTTSILAVVRLTPPGLLATAWLECVQAAGETLVDRLIETIAAKSPIRFEI